MVLAPAVYGRVLQGWPGALDDFQDQPEERMDDSMTMEPKEERSNYETPSENFEPAPRDYEEARSNNQGYFQDFAPKSIILDDNQSIESRFAFPDFPKWVLVNQVTRLRSFKMTPKWFNAIINTILILLNY